MRQRAQHQAIDADVATLTACDFERIAQQLHQLLATPESSPDGYAATASGSGTIGGGGGSDDTSVERAVAARQRHVDTLDDLVDQSVGALAAAARAARSAQHALDRIARIRDTTATTAPPPGCWALARVGGWEPVHASTLIDGESYALGRWAYDYVRRLGVLPTLEHCRAHRDGRRVFVPR